MNIVTTEKTSTSNKDKPTILIVDDTPDNIMLLSRLLKDRYNTKVANNGSLALQIAQSTPGLDLILLDVMMPGLDGYETCRQLKANSVTADIPVIFLTAKNQVEDEAMGLSLGAVDYIAKPISPPILFARVATQLTLAGARRQLQAHNENLEKLVQDRTAQLALMQEAIIMAMGTLAETRDNAAVSLGDHHIRRTQHYVRALARHLQHHPRFAADLTDENIELLYRSVPLHDIGKVGIPDRILLKPGVLDREEFEVMKLHAVYGRDTIMLVEKHIGGTNGFLMFAREIAHSHQEKWDGSGYPDRLAGEQIPLSARLMAVADVYDALISRRVYKPAFTHQQALDVMRKGRGTHFDPDVLDAFCEIEGQFAAIAEEFRDAEPDA
ncbi:response regulator [Massilia sp. NEAU-DD11]|uniref:Response regulator n=1 Tax=Massilia cellulosiltytica TaxID=2683234 RepID=A0A7X3FYN0_9BURK|nr:MULTISPECIES: two-component system response regulator [Telluria group]KQZ34466.1 two-component system response regulator [Massilia sp. Root1485]MVW60471.1 response regulator [Telluria cellulosilytica]